MSRNLTVPGTTSVLKYTGTVISQEHKPGYPGERRRIEKQGGRVQQKMTLYGPVGPERVWMKTQDLPGLAVSRSIGDGIAHSIGCTPTPDIRVVDIKSEHDFLIMASDGLWDVVTNEEAAMCIGYSLRQQEIDNEVRKSHFRSMKGKMSSRVSSRRQGPARHLNHACVEVGNISGRERGGALRRAQS